MSWHRAVKFREAYGARGDIGGDIEGLDHRRSAVHNRPRCSPRYNAVFPFAPSVSGSLEPAPLFHYVVVRGDLPRGIQAANIVHAAGESSPGGLAGEPGGVKSGTHAVCLSVPDEAALRAVAERLKRAGVRFVEVVEVDAPYTGQIMAIGCAPARKEALRRHLSALPLLK